MLVPAMAMREEQRHHSACHRFSDLLVRQQDPGNGPLCGTTPESEMPGFDDDDSSEPCDFSRRS